MVLLSARILALVTDEKSVAGYAYSAGMLLGFLLSAWLA